MAGLGWKPTLSLEPIAEHGLDAAELERMRSLTLEERLDIGIEMMRQARENALNAESIEHASH